LRKIGAGIFACFIACLPIRANAACANSGGLLTDAFCAGQAADAAASDFTIAFKAASSGLSPPAQAGLYHQQSEWRRIVNQDCTIRRAGAIFVNFRCAYLLIERRIAILKAQPYSSSAAPQSVGIHFFIVAHWNCPEAKTNYSIAFCAAANANAMMYFHRQAYARFMSTLDTNQQAVLAWREALWTHRVERSCALMIHGRPFIDFGCVGRAITARDAALTAIMQAPARHLRDNGVFAVRASAMPWFWHAGFNDAYPFGPPDGTGPTIITLSRLGAAPGQNIAIEYQSGVIVGGDGQIQTDPNGFWKPGLGGDGYGGMPTGHRLSALICAFTDRTGRLVEPPFLLGDGPTIKQVPSGASQLQVGLNQEIRFSDNAGGLNFSVIRVTGPGSEIPHAANIPGN